MPNPFCEDTTEISRMHCVPVPVGRVKPLVTVIASDDVPKTAPPMKSAFQTFLDAVWSDFKATNQHIGGKAAKFAGGIVVGSRVATEFGAVTPLRWALRGFGPLPAEFIPSGSIQVFEYTTAQRALLVAKAAGAKFVLVTIAFEGGVLVGAVINQALPEDAKMAIGGTINEIVNEGGWKLLFTNPFGAGM